jgi:hypothetical protein
MQMQLAHTGIALRNACHGCAAKARCQLYCWKRPGQADTGSLKSYSPLSTFQAAPQPLQVRGE